MFGFLTRRIPAEETKAHRAGLAMVIGLTQLERGGFEKPGWTFLFEDIAAEAAAARLTLRTDSPADCIKAIGVLPPRAIQRLYSAHSAYFTREDEAKMESHLRRLDRTEAERLRKRRAAVRALIAGAESDAAIREYNRCPRGRAMMSPSAFLEWIQQQSPDTWHVVVGAWRYVDDGFDASIAFILDSPDCDAATAATYFFQAAAGLAGEDPAQLGGVSLARWDLMKKTADRWSAGFYKRAELAPLVDPHVMAGFDTYAEEETLPYAIPPVEERKFGGRAPRSDFAYEGGGRVAMNFDRWRTTRPASPGCGQDFPACCER